MVKYVCKECEHGKCFAEILNDRSTPISCLRGFYEPDSRWEKVNAEDLKCDLVELERKFEIYKEMSELLKRHGLKLTEES